MNYYRVIPCLLLQNRGLVKTTKFKSPRYIGDPINAVRIFNDLEVDEILFLDIEATEKKREVDYTLLKDIIDECFIPFSYGGGIQNLHQIEKLLKAGIEKVAIQTAAMENPGLIEEAAKYFGSQSIIAVLEVNKNIFGRLYVSSHRGKKFHFISPTDCVRKFYNLGAGEIMVNTIYKDGTMSGYDIPLIRSLSEIVDIPLIACGGAGTLEDLKQAIHIGGASAVAAGSLFVYYGKEKGVLINYPKREVLDKLFYHQKHERA